MAVDEEKNITAEQINWNTGMMEYQNHWNIGIRECRP
jgi:hypothetical protein